MPLLESGMRMEVRWSKGYLLVMSLFICAFGVVFSQVPGLPLLAKIGGVGLAVGLFLAATKSLLFGKPTIILNEEGLWDSRLGKQVIPWKDVLAFQHAPRVERTAGGQMGFSPVDGWRAIRLWVHKSDDSFLTKMQKFKPGPPLPGYPKALGLVMDFTGMDTPSLAVVEYLRQNVPGVREVAI